MQTHRSATPAPMSTSVRGLGVCDVLEVELTPEQLESLQGVLDAHIAALQYVLPTLVASELREAHHALRLLQRMRPGTNSLVGPAGLVLELVKACVDASVNTLARRVEDAGDPAALDHGSRLAAAWTRTLADCRAVEDYSFEADVDPVRAW